MRVVLTNETGCRTSRRKKKTTKARIFMARSWKRKYNTCITANFADTITLKTYTEIILPTNAWIIIRSRISMMRTSKQPQPPSAALPKPSCDDGMLEKVGEKVVVLPGGAVCPACFRTTMRTSRKRTILLAVSSPVPSLA
jgi:hypothetical protein